MQMELRRLRYFVAVAEELHFGRAAKTLHIAQPALSQQIKALEAELGVKLLQRSNRGASLTEAGKVLLAEAKFLIECSNRAVRRTRAAGEGLSGTLHVSFTRSGSSEAATTIVEEFRRRFPDIELRLATAFTTRHIEQLREGTLDVAFVRPPLHADELATLVVGNEELVLAMPADHPLAHRERRRIELAEMRHEPVVSWPQESGPGFHDCIRRQVWGEEAPNVSREEPEEEQMLRAVARGAGIAVITDSKAGALSVPGVAIRRFAYPAPTVDVALAWRADDRSPVLRRFIQVAEAGVQDR